MKDGTKLTHGMRAQYETLRRNKQLEMADRVLGIVGVYKAHGERFITSADLYAHELELLELLGDVRAWYSAKERQRLYKNNRHLGLSVAKLVLQAAGHPLERSPCAGGGGRFSLASGQ
jgi:hypothetical protein